MSITSDDIVAYTIFTVFSCAQDITDLLHMLTPPIESVTGAPSVGIVDAVDAGPAPGSDSKTFRLPSAPVSEPLLGWPTEPASGTSRMNMLGMSPRKPLAHQPRCVLKEGNTVHMIKARRVVFPAQA